MLYGIIGLLHQCDDSIRRVIHEIIKEEIMIDNIS